MSTSAGQPPAEADRVTRAILEHASLSSREARGQTIVGLRVRG